MATGAPSFSLPHFNLVLVGAVQLNLVEAEIAGRGRLVAVRTGREVKMRFAGDDDVRSVRHVRDGEPVGRVHARLRGNERPGPGAGISASRLECGEER